MSAIDCICKKKIKFVALNVPIIKLTYFMQLTNNNHVIIRD